GRIFNYYMSLPTITNATIYGNGRGGIQNYYSGSSVIKKSILYGNIGGEIVIDSTAGLESTASISNSIVQGGFSSGPNILDVEPMIVSVSNCYFNLTSCTPAGNAGNNTAVTVNIPEDLNWNTSTYSRINVDLVGCEF